MIAKAARQLPPQMPAPPSYQKVNPGDQPVLFLVLRSATLPLSAVDEYAETHDRAAHLDGQRRRAGATCSARRSTRCASTSTRASSRRTASASTRSRPRSRTPTSTCRPARSTAPTQTFAVQANGQLLRRGGLRPDDRRLPQRQPGAARRGRARLRRRRERQERGLVQRRARDLPRRSRSSRAPTSSRSSTRSRRCCRPSASSCRRRCRSTSAATARSRSASRSRDVKFTLLLTIGLVVARHLPVPAQRLGDDHSQPRAAGLDRRRPSR